MHASSEQRGSGGAAGQSTARADLDELIGAGLALEIVPGRLYFASLSARPAVSAAPPATIFVTIDDALVYRPFFADFGPLHLAHVVRFCRLMQHHLGSEGTEGDNDGGGGVGGEAKAPHRVLFYTSHNGHQRANAACLVACYALLCHQHTPSSAAALLARAYPPLLPFRDASFGVSAFNLTINDVLRGLDKARVLGWIDVRTFDVEEYEHFESLEHGDWNWLVPGRLIGFSSPVDDVPGREAALVVRAFRERRVSLVVRLNEPLYTKRAFTEVGIRHAALEFEDGGVPPDSLVCRFLRLVEEQPPGSAVAVHCKAGLGRTGTMIGLYCIKAFGFTAREFIGWARLCRPGSVIGPQQHFLEAAERRLRRPGAAGLLRLCGGLGVGGGGSANTAAAVNGRQQQQHEHTALRTSQREGEGGCKTDKTKSAVDKERATLTRKLALFDPDFALAKTQQQLHARGHDGANRGGAMTPLANGGPSRNELRHRAATTMKLLKKTWPLRCSTPGAAAMLLGTGGGHQRALTPAVGANSNININADCGDGDDASLGATVASGAQAAIVPRFAATIHRVDHATRLAAVLPAEMTPSPSCPAAVATRHEQQQHDDRRHRRVSAPWLVGTMRPRI